MSIRDYIESTPFMRTRIRRERLKNTFYPVARSTTSMEELDRRVRELLQAADDLHIAGKPRSDRGPLLARIVELQDQAAAESGIDAFGFRIVGSPFWGDNIGHLTVLDTMEKLRQLGHLTTEPRLVAFQHPANEHYLDYWSEHFSVLRLPKDEIQRLNAALSPLQECIDFFRSRTGPVDLYRGVNQANREWGARPPLLHLSPADAEWGRAQLAALGVDDGKWFVTLHVRAGERRRERSAPDADVFTYIPAIERVVRAGGAVIRIGNPLMPPLPAMRGVVDLAHHPHRSARLDAFLFAACRFFIGTNSGPLNVPPTFGVPVLHTNAVSLGVSQYFRKSFIVPKTYKEKRSNRTLPLDELMRSSAAWTVNPDADPRLSLCDSTSDEIASATEEMLLKTHDVTSPEDPLTVEQARAALICAAHSETSDAVFAQSFLDSRPGWA